VLAFKNFNQLISHGYDNFKRTVALNYFTFLIGRGDPQLKALEDKLDAAERERCLKLASSLPDDAAFSWGDQLTYRYFVLLLWRYAQKIDVHHYLDQLEEPAEGNPVTVPLEGKRVSQDLANSLIEYYSMKEAVDFAHCRHILEIGGGYGRNAYVILKLNPHVHYMLVDVPPALWIAQRYLSAVFPNKRVFAARDFTDYASVRGEMEQCEIVCLLPHQLALLPSRRFELALNISSFAEMQLEQINAYFAQLQRVTRDYFYTKQWKVSQNAFDALEITEPDYPLPPRWRKIYSRTCAVQPLFFESLYDATPEWKR
jgi:putative sugar O-methyltransferase